MVTRQDTEKAVVAEVPLGVDRAVAVEAVIIDPRRDPEEDAQEHLYRHQFQQHLPTL